MAVHPPVLVLCVWVLGFFHVGAPQELSTLDSSFCIGNLQVIYPELDVDKCLVVPKEFRQKLSTVWMAPEVRFAAAKTDQRYTLVMVDPDAPSRARPTAALWRHWVVENIQGAGLAQGRAQGNTLTDYRPPTPPRETGFHRYQFLLFEQPSDTPVSLTEQEALYRAGWDLQAFTHRFALGTPVASLQFLTQNYND